MATKKKAAPKAAPKAAKAKTDDKGVTTVTHENGTVVKSWIDEKTGKPTSSFQRHINAKYKHVPDGKNGIKLVPLDDADDPADQD